MLILHRVSGRACRSRHLQDFLEHLTQVHGDDPNLK